MLPLNQPEAPQSINPEVRDIMVGRLQTVWVNLDRLGRNPAVAAAFQAMTSEQTSTPQPQAAKPEVSITPAPNITVDLSNKAPQGTLSTDKDAIHDRVTAAQQQVEAVFAGSNL